VRGAIVAQDVFLELKCPRCDSVIEWSYGKPEFRIVKEGNRNHKRQAVVFE
jgi:phage FluMu protein Com